MVEAQLSINHSRTVKIKLFNLIANIASQPSKVESLSLEIYKTLNWLEEVEKAGLARTARIFCVTKAELTKEPIATCIEARIRMPALELENIPTQPAKRTSLGWSISLVAPPRQEQPKP